MTVAFDATSTLANGTGDPRSWTHTPSGTPRGVLVIAVADSGTDRAPTATYGGVSMTECTDSPAIAPAAGDDQVVYAFFLGSSIPTGAQTVQISSLDTDTFFAAAATVTASADTEVGDDAKASGVSADSVSLTTARECFVMGGLGNDTASTGNISPGTVCDTQVIEVDFGVDVGGIYRTATTHAAGTFTADVVSPATGQSVFYAVAIQEVAGAAATHPGWEQSRGGWW